MTYLTMKRWVDFFAMIRDARAHIDKFGFGIAPYNDIFLQMIGFSCEETGIVWQINVMTFNIQMEKEPLIKELMYSYEGTHALARALAKEPKNFPEKWAAPIKIIRKETKLHSSL